MDKNFYLTTAIDYANGSPHLGHAVGHYYVERGYAVGRDYKELVAQVEVFAHFSLGDSFEGKPFDGH